MEDKIKTDRWLADLPVESSCWFLERKEEEKTQEMEKETKEMSQKCSERKEEWKEAQTAKEMAEKDRNGDCIVSHLTLCLLYCQLCV